MKGANLLLDLRWHAERKKTPAIAADAYATIRETIPRIEELERAAGAAAMAMALDMIRHGQPLDKAEPNSAIAMICDAVGLDRANPHDLVRFRNAYMERFKPRKEEKNDG